MNRVKLYILPLCLVLSSLIAGVQTIKAVRSSASLEAETASRNLPFPSSTSGPAGQLSSEEMLTAKNLFSALAQKNLLPVNVAVSTNKIVISSEKNGEVLQNYEGILSYLTGISDLPYSMEYKNFCIGRGCTKDIFLEIALTR